MTKRESFLDILLSSTPEEINDFIAKKSKSRKMVNAITFIYNNKEKESEENENG